MDIQQHSRNSSMEAMDRILSSPCFPLDSSLDAELSLHNSTNEAWGNTSFSGGEKTDFTFTTAFDPNTLSRYQSGSPTSTPTEFGTGALSNQTTPTVTTENYAPTVRLQRPSFDESSFKNTLPPNSSTSTTTTTVAESTTMAGGSVTTPTDELDNLNLTFQRKSFPFGSTTSFMDGNDIANFVGQYLPVASGTRTAYSAPSSPFTEVPSALNLDFTSINNTDNRNGRSAPGSPTYLQTSPWGDETPISPISPSSSPPSSSSALFNGTFDQSTQQPWSFNPSTQSGSSTPFQTPSTMYASTSPSFSNIDQSQQTQPHRRSAHNEVEKKYRNNINDRIAELKEAVPALKYARVKKDNTATHTGEDNSNNNTLIDEEDDSGEPVIMDGVIVATKLNKATILQKATEYVYHLQHSTKELKQDIEALLGTIDSQTPGGQEITNQYRRHVMQREEMQKQRLICSEKIKRLKKSDLPAHHYHYHLQLKGEDRGHQHLLFMQQQEMARQRMNQEMAQPGNL